MFLILTSDGVVALGLSIGLLVLTRRQAVALRRSVQVPIDMLLADLDAVRDGRLERPQKVDGPEEFVRLSSGLTEAIDSLATARQTAAISEEGLRERSRQLAVVLRLTREVSGSLNMRYVLRGVVAAAEALEPGSRIVLWVVDAGIDRLEPLVDSAGPDLKPIGLEPIGVGEGDVGKSARFGRVVTLADADTAAEAIPMVVGARVIGVLELHRPAPLGEAITGERAEVLEMLAGHAAAAIEAARLHEVTAKLSMTDTLTGLANRRQLEQDLQAEVAISVRHNRPLGFAMIDADQFKAYNDDFGHLSGDRALQELSRALAEAVRASDTAYRYGGEEFAIVLRETTEAEAYRFGVRLCEVVAHRFRDPGRPRPLTVSIGTAAIPRDASNASSLVAAADAALYEAKAAGRDCARSASPIDGRAYEPGERPNR